MSALVVLCHEVHVVRTSRSACTCLLLTSPLPRMVPLLSNNFQLNRQLVFPSQIMCGFSSATASEFLNNLCLPFTHYFQTLVFTDIINDIIVVSSCSTFIHSSFASSSFVSPVHACRMSSSCSSPFHIIRSRYPSSSTLYKHSACAFRLPLSNRSLTWTLLVFSGL